MENNDDVNIDDVNIDNEGANLDDDGDEIYYEEDECENPIYEEFDINNIDFNDVNDLIKDINIYEKTFLIGFRAEQISNGGVSFLDEKRAKELINPIAIAEEEFNNGLICFDIIRHVNDGKKIKNVCFKVNNE